MTRAIQETIGQALIRPSVPRVFIHVDCGGWVLFSLEGGTCLECGTGPLTLEQYAKPTAGAA